MEEQEEKEEAAPHVAEKQCQQQWATVPNQEHFIGAEPQCKRPVAEEEAEKQTDRQPHLQMFSWRQAISQMLILRIALF